MNHKSGVMQRIPEPDLMDDREQAMAYAEADFSEPHNAFVKHFRIKFPEFTSGKVLDLGCGTADVVVRFAREFPSVNITGIDGAKAMLDIGLREIKQKRLDRRICLHMCKLPDTQLSTRKFDAIISNSLLHHLSDPLILWQTVKQCAKQEAPIFIMDLLRPRDTASAQELVRLYASDASPVLQKDFFNSLLAAYSIDEIMQQIKAVRMGHLKIETVSDRHVLIWGDNHE